MKTQTASALPFALGHVSYFEVAGGGRARHLHGRSASGVARHPQAIRQLPSSQQARPATASTLHFLLQQATNGDSFLRLGLYENGRLLIQWVLPTGAPALHDEQAAPTYLVETSQPLPKEVAVLDEGGCQPTEELYLPTAQWLERGLRHGYLHLALRGRELHGEFLLQRLHPGGPTWELYLRRKLPATSAA